MPIIKLPSGTTFQSEESEPILDAALRANVVLEHSCRTGRCGTCRAKAKPGTTLPLRPEIGLSEVERNNDWILSCIRCAKTDVDLDVVELPNLNLPPARLIPCRIGDLAKTSANVMRVVLRLPPNAPFQFRAGQYIDVIGHGGVRRSYSIASGSPNNATLELYISRLAGGTMSDYWFSSARVGDLLRLHGPKGTFLLRDCADLDVVFLATGTGIAPVKAMLATTSSAPLRYARSIDLYWGGRNPADFYWDPEFVENCHVFTRVLSQPDIEWRGSRGHVQQALLQKANDWNRTVVYACGSERMIHESRELLRGLGLPEQRFFSDAFVSSS